MEDLFREVKERVQIEQVCELLGINLSRSHKALCPFHNEKTPSFSVSPSKNIFYCFGCGKKGDCITLVSELLKIKPYEAVVFLNNNLGLGVQIGNGRINKDAINKYDEKKKSRENLKKWELDFFIRLTNKYHQLKKYEEIMRKVLKNEPELYFNDKNIVYYLQNKGKMEYFIEQLIDITNEKDILYFKKTNGKVVS